MNEAQLIEGLQNLGTSNNAKGELAFKYIVTNYQSIIYNTSLGIVGNTNDAKDIAQDVFVQLYRSASTFRGDSKISTWLYRIAVNKSLNHIRNNKKHNVVLSIHGSGKNSSNEIREIQIKDQANINPEQITEQNDHKKALRIAIDSLAKNQKTAFVLKNYDNCSYKEITEIMGMSLSSVESLIHRAKKNLQKSLRYYYETNVRK